MYADLLILLRPSTAVMATKSRHVSEVMATVQITAVAEEKKEQTMFLALDLYNAKHLKVSSKGTVLRMKQKNMTSCDNII